MPSQLNTIKSPHSTAAAIELNGGIQLLLNMIELVSKVGSKELFARI
jgi:hypothetical protein